MTLSVVIATYNGSKYLREQLDSVLSQTLPPDQIVVADDGSTDGTWDIVTEYEQRYPDLFVVYRNESRLGPHKNFKKAFSFAKCDLIAPCDQDDIWHSEKLERSVAKIMEGWSFVFCQETIQYEESGSYEVIRAMPSLKDCILSNSISGHLIVFRREMLDTFTLAPEITYDWGLTLMAATLGTGTAIDYIGCIWRRHRDVVTSEFSDFGRKTGVVRKNKYYKFVHAFLSVFKGEKSEVVARRLRSVAQVIKGAKVSQSANDMKVRWLALSVANDMSEQRVCTLLRASYNYMSLDRVVNGADRHSFRERIGASLFSFCYPAGWWWDYHNHKAL